MLCSRMAREDSAKSKSSLVYELDFFFVFLKFFVIIRLIVIGFKN